MLMSEPVRRFALTTHVVTSVGWMGAVACFLALAVKGLTSTQPAQVQAAYLAMEVLCWAVIVPLSLLSPVTGVAQPMHVEGEHDKRLKGGYAWRTVAAATGMPASVIEQIGSPAISEVQPLQFMLG